MTKNMPSGAAFFTITIYTLHIVHQSVSRIVLYHREQTQYYHGVKIQYYHDVKTQYYHGENSILPLSEDSVLPFNHFP